MANYVFDEAAREMAGAGLDWENATYEMFVYQDDTPVFDATSTWDTAGFILPDMPTGVGGKAVVELDDTVITATGGCSSANVQFKDLAIIEPGEALPGFVLRRQSDNLLICHVDQGIEGIDPFRVDQYGEGSGGIIHTRLNPQTFTFWLIPDSQNRKAWFRP